MNIHSFKTKLILYITSIVIFAILIISVMSLVITYYSIDKEISEKLPLKLNLISSEIDNKLNLHSSIVRTLSSLAQSNKNTLSRDAYVAFLKDINFDNKPSFGFGIWFEPYRYGSAIKYFGPYVYKDGDKIIYTTDYETASYDFHNQDWYKTAKGKPENSVSWSSPFYDDATKITMISAVSPFFDSNKIMMGASSGDFDITELQNIVNGMKDEQIDLEGFLLDSDGTFMTYQNKEFIMKKKITDHPDKEFAALGQKIITDKNGRAELQLDGETHLIFYEQIKQTGWILCTTVSKSKLYAPVRNLAIAIAIIVFISIGISLAASYYISGKISNPVRAMRDFAAKIAEGDFTGRINVKQKDEIGQLANALNSSADNLEHLISNIIIASEQLHSAVDEITKGNMNLSQRTTEQASALEEIASTIEENTATVERNADNSKSAQDLTEGGVEKSVGAIGQADMAIGSINEINQSSKKIAEIISVINEIAFQTNLLALNAAVEAARAGDQGRGFAVVAGEVRNLAQRSGGAAKEIEQLIRESVSKVEKGTELVVESGAFLKEIANSAKTTAQIIAEIAAASDEQRAGMEQINKAIMELDSMTQQNAALVEETASASEQMANQAQELLALMSRFTIRQDKDKSSGRKEIHLKVNTEAEKKKSEQKKAEKQKNTQTAKPAQQVKKNNIPDEEIPKEFRLEKATTKTTVDDFMKDDGFEKF
ncbi:MAG TPA: methyl-accepting chemotaxis protein [Spirochaetota bacterium]|nr:methyl-accepting chemotaxis protein [Spirochaetota bacterium]HPF07181.1 methyl-accepting chemotaxis protein [Spirochaetota bacterium]HPJ41616.1 methyl-accepting chemotaxis protein [Spirochaetota bacterium]HPR36713.1 methyl-accepting chemotaxis protein [Spirochaetota bacterium]HRX48540.1 methyl-accepting chemotaxis protein [Spirochaetota bacterium]